MVCRRIYQSRPSVGLLSPIRWAKRRLYGPLIRESMREWRAELAAIESALLRSGFARVALEESALVLLCYSILPNYTTVLYCTNRVSPEAVGIGAGGAGGAGGGR